MSQAGNRGIVLVAVLFAVAIMSVLVVAISALTRSGIASQGLESRRLATHLALRSGVESAKALIVATPAAERVFLDGAPVTLELGSDVEAEVTIRDAAGLADLNRTELPVLEALLRSGLKGQDAADVIRRITEWRKQAEERAAAEAPAQPKTPPAAGEAPADEKSGKPDVPVFFVSVDQLLAMAEAKTGADLQGQLTVFNPTGLVNPLAAPEGVLLAIPGVTPADLGAIKAARKNRAARAEQLLQPLLDKLKSFLTVQEPSVFMIGVRLKEGPGIIASSSTAAVVQLAEKGPLPFRTLWVSGL